MRTNVPSTMTVPSIMDKVRMFDNDPTSPRKNDAKALGTSASPKRGSHEGHVTNNRFKSGPGVNEENRVDYSTPRGGVDSGRTTWQKLDSSPKLTPQPKYYGHYGRSPQEKSLHQYGRTNEKRLTPSPVQTSEKRWTPSPVLTSRSGGSKGRDLPPKHFSPMRPMARNDQEESPVGSSSTISQVSRYQQKMGQPPSGNMPKKTVASPVERSIASSFTDAYEKFMHDSKKVPYIGSSTLEGAAKSKKEMAVAESHENKAPYGSTMKQLPYKTSHRKEVVKLHALNTSHVSLKESSVEKKATQRALERSEGNRMKSQAEAKSKSTYEKLLARHRKTAFANSPSENLRRLKQASPRTDQAEKRTETGKKQSFPHFVANKPKASSSKSNEKSPSSQHSHGGFQTELMSAAKALSRKYHDESKKSTSYIDSREELPTSRSTDESPLTMFQEFRNELKHNLDAANVLLAEAKSGISSSSSSSKSSLSNKELATIARAAVTMSETKKKKRNGLPSNSSLAKMKLFQEQRKQLGLRGNVVSSSTSGHNDRVPPRNEHLTAYLSESKPSFGALALSLSNTSNGIIAPSYSNATSHSEATARASNTQNSRASLSARKLRRRNTKGRTPTPETREPSEKMNEQPLPVKSVESRPSTRPSNLGRKLTPLKPARDTSDKLNRKSVDLAHVVPRPQAQMARTNSATSAFVQQETGRKADTIEHTIVQDVDIRPTNLNVERKVMSPDSANRNVKEMESIAGENQDGFSSFPSDNIIRDENPLLDKSAQSHVMDIDRVHKESFEEKTTIDLNGPGPSSVSNDPEQTSPICSSKEDKERSIDTETPCFYHSETENESKGDIQQDSSFHGKKQWREFQKQTVSSSPVASKGNEQWTKHDDYVDSTSVSGQRLHETPAYVVTPPLVPTGKSPTRNDGAVDRGFHSADGQQNHHSMNSITTDGVKSSDSMDRTDSPSLRRSPKSLRNSSEQDDLSISDSNDSRGSLGLRDELFEDGGITNDSNDDGFTNCNESQQYEAEQTAAPSSSFDQTFGSQVDKDARLESELNDQWHQRQPLSDPVIEETASSPATPPATLPFQRTEFSAAFPTDAIQFNNLDVPSTPPSTRQESTTPRSLHSTSSLSDNEEFALYKMPKARYTDMRNQSPGRKTDMGDMKLISPRQNWHQISLPFDTKPKLGTPSSLNGSTQNGVVLDETQHQEAFSFRADEEAFLSRTDEKPFLPEALDDEAVFPGVKSRKASFERRISEESLCVSAESPTRKRDPFLDSPKDKANSKVNAIRSSFERSTPVAPIQPVISTPKHSPRCPPLQDTDFDEDSKLPSTTERDQVVESQAQPVSFSLIVGAPDETFKSPVHAPPDQTFKPPVHGPPDETFQPPVHVPAPAPVTASNDETRNSPVYGSEHSQSGNGSITQGPDHQTSVNSSKSSLESQSSEMEVEREPYVDGKDSTAAANHPENDDASAEALAFVLKEKEEKKNDEKGEIDDFYFDVGAWPEEEIGMTSELNQNDFFADADFGAIEVDVKKDPIVRTTKASGAIGEISCSATADMSQFPIQETFDISVGDTPHVHTDNPFNATSDIEKEDASLDAETKSSKVPSVVLGEAREKEHTIDPLTENSNFKTDEKRTYNNARVDTIDVGGAHNSEPGMVGVSNTVQTETSNVVVEKEMQETPVVQVDVRKKQVPPRSPSRTPKKRQSTIGATTSPTRHNFGEGFPSDGNPAASEGVRRMADALQWWQERYSATASQVENSAIKDVFNPSPISVGSSEAANYLSSRNCSPINNNDDAAAAENTRIKEDDDVFSGLEEDAKSVPNNEESMNGRTKSDGNTLEDRQTDSYPEERTRGNLGERNEGPDSPTARLSPFSRKHEHRENKGNGISRTSRRRGKDSYPPDMCMVEARESGVHESLRHQNEEQQYESIEAHGSQTSRTDSESQGEQFARLFLEKKGGLTPKTSSPPPPPPSLSSAKRRDKHKKRRTNQRHRIETPTSPPNMRRGAMEHHEMSNPGVTETSLSVSDSSTSGQKLTPQEIVGDEMVKTVTSDITESQVSGPVVQRGFKYIPQEEDEETGNDSGVEADVNSDVYISKNWLRDKLSYSKDSPTSTALDLPNENHEDTETDQNQDTHSSASGSAEVEFDGFESVNTNTISGSHEPTVSPDEESGEAFFLYAILDTFTDVCKMTGTSNGLSLLQYFLVSCH